MKDETDFFDKAKEIAKSIDNGTYEQQTKPLNEVEILELWTKKNKLNGAQGIIDFVRAVEKAHGIK